MWFKPKWQNKDTVVRRAAVATDHDAQLLAALPEIARSDTDSGVRLAALKRLNNYEAWRERSTGDAEPEVRHAARQAYLVLLCIDDARVPSLARRIAELDTLDASEIEKIASQAINIDLRAAALARAIRPAFLTERALGDADAGIRLAALQRIDDIAALERIAERARSVKHIAARERYSRSRWLLIFSISLASSVQQYLAPSSVQAGRGRRRCVAHRAPHII